MFFQSFVVNRYVKKIGVCRFFCRERTWRKEFQEHTRRTHSGDWAGIAATRGGGGGAAAAATAIDT